MMNFRLARPAKLVDVNRVEELAYLRGATVKPRRASSQHQRRADRRQVCAGRASSPRRSEHSDVVARGWPLLRQAVRHVGHPPIRARGTLGGSCAHADPTAELPAALTALDARFHLRSGEGDRVLGAPEFFVSYLTTALRADELLVEVEVPPLPAGARTAFVEHARTHGDWAIAGAAVVVAPGQAAIALLGAGATPVRAAEAETALAGGAGAAEAARLAGMLMGGGWRAALATSLVRRALEEAGA